MAIGRLSGDEFEAILRRFIRPSSPIDSFEYLVDRERQLRAAEEAFATPGRHLFIYGARGVGKTSLAHTVAHRHESSEHAPVLCACGRSTSFASLVTDIASTIAGRSALRQKQSSTSFGLSALGLSASHATTEQPRALPEAVDLNRATALLTEATAGRRSNAIAVIDEFENLADVEDRYRFAELIKQLSDRQVKLTLVFCGIGRSLADMFAGHASAHRYLEGIQVQPLSFEQRQAIVSRAAEALGLEVDWQVLLQIANVSDGFPHYVHLIAQKMFWTAQRREETVDTLGMADYLEGIRGAIASVEEHLRQAYDRAVKKDRGDYEEILWSVADTRALERHHEQVYHQSYVPIMTARLRVPLEYRAFVTRLGSLKTAAHGSILAAERPKWVRFREDMLRGYVRMVAVSQGVTIAM